MRFNSSGWSRFARPGTTVTAVLKPPAADRPHGGLVVHPGGVGEGVHPDAEAALEPGLGLADLVAELAAEPAVRRSEWLKVWAPSSQSARSSVRTSFSLSPVAGRKFAMHM